QYRQPRLAGSGHRMDAGQARAGTPAGRGQERRCGDRAQADGGGRFLSRGGRRSQRRSCRRREIPEPGTCRKTAGPPRLRRRQGAAREDRTAVTKCGIMPGANPNHGPCMNIRTFACLCSLAALSAMSAPVLADSPSPTATQVAQDSQAEIDYWNSIKTSKKAEDYQNYLNKYPS